MITSLTLEKHWLDPSRMTIKYTDEGNNWIGGGDYADVYIVDGFIVLQDSLGRNRPLMVCKDIQDLSKRLFEKTNCELITGFLATKI
jgi:hypothetical protein